MTSVGKLAGGLTILESIWVICMQFTVPVIPCPLGGCPGPQFSPLYSQISILLALVLLVDGLLGVWGARFAFPVGAGLSAILLLVMGYSAWAESGFTYLIGEWYRALAGAAFATAALAANLAAARSKGGLSEQANPMNLPVFG